VPIVAAGVHRPARLRAIFDRALLLDRQGVHVAAQQEHLVRSLALDDRLSAGDGDARLDLGDPEQPQPLDDDATRPKPFQAEFRVHVQLAARGDQFRFPFPLKAAARDRAQALDLEQILTDVAAFGIASSLDRRIKEASAQGFAPAWFARQNATGNSSFAFYPYWIVFHSGSGSSSAGTSGGAASSGGAGAGGSF